MKYSFKNDYSEGTHPQILEALLRNNSSQQLGYGEDSFSIEAKKLILEKIGNASASIYFLSGGTQTNLITISSLLRPHEAVISATTGHIVTNETGSIEAVGHKILQVTTPSGKLTKSDIQVVLDQHTLRPHVVKPRLVYISNATELGTLYNRQELQELFNFCEEHQLILFMDGARLGQALLNAADLNWQDCAKYTHAFYIGGTKNGALMGEALVFNFPDLGADFDYFLKQKGALLAKGRILGLQFLEFFKDNLYMDLAEKAKNAADQIKNAFIEKNIAFLSPPESNQLFPVLNAEQIRILEQHFEFYVWKKIDEEKAAIRLITSWATEKQQIEKMKNLIKEL